MAFVAVDYIGEWIFNYKPDFSNWKMIDGKHYCPVCDGVRSLIECIHLKKK